MYYWYTATEDNDGGRSISGIWEFTTEISTNAIAIKNLVKQFDKEDEFKDKQEANALKVHLTAVAQFEKKEAGENVVKHMKGFKQLLDHQLGNSLISDEAYQTTLETKVNLFLKKWVTIRNCGVEKCIYNCVARVLMLDTKGFIGS